MLAETAKGDAAPTGPVAAHIHSRSQVESAIFAISGFAGFWSCLEGDRPNIWSSSPKLRSTRLK